MERSQDDPNSYAEKGGVAETDVYANLPGQGRLERVMEERQFGFRKRSGRSSSTCVEKRQELQDEVCLP